MIAPLDKVIVIVAVKRMRRMKKIRRQSGGGVGNGHTTAAIRERRS